MLLVLAEAAASVTGCEIIHALSNPAQRCVRISVGGHLGVSENRATLFGALSRVSFVFGV